MVVGTTVVLVVVVVGATVVLVVLVVLTTRLEGVANWQYSVAGLAEVSPKVQSSLASKSAHLHCVA